MRASILLVGATAVSTAMAQLTIPGVSELVSDILPTSFASSLVSEVIPTGLAELTSLACITSSEMRSCLAALTSNTCISNTAIPTGDSAAETRVSDCACQASSSLSVCYSSYCSGATVPTGLVDISCGPASATGSTTTGSVSGSATNAAATTSRTSGGAPGSYLVPAEGSLLAGLVGLLAFFL